MPKTRIYITYPEKLIKEPVIYNVGQKFKVVTNIRSATVSSGIGVIGLELDGEQSEITKAVQYIKDLGIKVKPIEQDVME
ncbi:MAG: NIL domain-containing protein [Chlamydiae bacterium]|nr:NIL domain-containing protein [Chlamydiota bacterium]MBI3266375.1 NIL domain-containing protein [Chlamydiota bacterium]